MKALVNKIIPFSAVDGPGNRTAVFLQGCNFNCRYCHNPETINRCVGCGACVATCPVGALSFADPDAAGNFVPETMAPSQKIFYNKALCVECDQCLKTCPHGSSPRTELLTPEEVFERVKKQMPFIRGVTVSGGECTQQAAFLKEFFTICKEAGLTTLADSNGTYDFLKDPELLQVMDGVMLDVKSWDPEEHQMVTGMENDMVRKNLVALAEIGKLEEVRTVVVPGLFNYEQTVLETGKALAPFLKKQSIRYKLIAYRPMGVREKYAIYNSPSQDLLSELADQLRELGFTDIVLI